MATGAGIPVRQVTGSGTTSNKKMRVVTTRGVETPVVRVLKPGAASVSDLLNKVAFRVAHRGGSTDWPEMSDYAYMRSSMEAVDALEISVARSSDGVYFGLHDGSLDRTSYGTGGGSGTTYVASTMTWATIQASPGILATTTNNSSQPDRPYMKLDDFLAQFASTHVIFIDPKAVSASYYSELIGIMDANGGPTRFIGKYYGVSGNVGNTTGWAKACSDAGYERWGYFYDDDAANFAAYQGRWSILGLSYPDAQSYWDTMLSYGKPVIGHVIPSRSGVDLALDKGASGLMISGVLEANTGAPHLIVEDSTCG